METDIESAKVPEQPPSCIVCGRQDATLRAVTYPFSFSLVVVTFRRAFSGVWCARHRRRYLLLASLITASVGWFGIPFGLIYTPIILFILAKGGLLDSPLNFQLLTALAERKLFLGDREGAIACLEQSLQFGDSPDVRQRLSTMQLQVHHVASEGFFSSAGKFLVRPATLIACVLIGWVIGVLDLVLSYLLAPLFGSSSTIFTVMLSWIPLSLMLYFGVLAVQSLTGWSLRKIGSPSQPFSITLAISATLFAWYAILEIRALIVNASLLFQSYLLSSRDAIFGARALLAYGGVLEFINNPKLLSTSGLIYDILLGAAAACSLLAGIYAARQSARWQGLLAQIRKVGLFSADRSSTAPWASLVGVLAIVVLATFVLSPGRFRNIEEAYIHLSDGLSALNDADDSMALTEFDQLVKIWPESALGHASLALIYAGREKFDPALTEAQAAIARDSSSIYTNFIMAGIRYSRGEFAQAVENFKQVQAAQPTMGLPHAYLATLYYLLDKPELADQEIQLALDREASGGDAADILGLYYGMRTEFDLAEIHLLKAIEASPSADTYLALSSVYTSQGKFDSAKNAIEKAKALGAEPTDLHLAKANLLEFQGNYRDAASELRSALQLTPRSSAAHAALSFIYYQLAQNNDSAMEADKALEINPYNAQAYIEQAFAYHAQGKLADALAAAEKAVALSPKTDRAHYILGLSYKDSGRTEEAIREFETFLSLYWDRPYGKQLKESAERFLMELR